MGEWKEYRIEDVCSRITSGSTPSRKRLDYFGGTIPWLSSKEVNFNRINTTDEHITELGLRNSSAKWIAENAVIVAMYGATAGRVALSRIRLTTNQACCNLTADHTKCDYEYLFYFLRSKYDELVQLSTGVAQQNLSLAVLKEFPLLLPAVSEQRAIASVLSSLDAKIDLLQRQNKTLEAMAETLFRQWFVEEAEEGWEEYVLTDIATHCKDSVNPGQHPTRTYHHYSLPAYDEGRKPSPELGDTIKSSKYVVPENAVLISKLNPRFPRVWPVRDKKHEHPISSTEFQVFVPKKDEMFGFLYCFLISKPVQDELASAASGTSGSHQRVSPDDIKGLTFQAKSKQQLVDFSKVVDPMLEKIESNKDQVANLTSLRDTLLPKLMSGEVRVEETAN
jgi:type I restriction enzyme S subunit